MPTRTPDGRWETTYRVSVRAQRPGGEQSLLTERITVVTDMPVRAVPRFVLDNFVPRMTLRIVVADEQGNEVYELPLEHGQLRRVTS